MKHTIKIKAFTIAAVTLLAMGVAQTAKAEGRACSNATLNGTFLDRDTGFITAPGMAGPFAGINLETFDGHGGLAGSGISSLNGNVVAGTFKGTYTVNPDCTGTYTVLNSLGLTVNAFFVIADGGNEIQDIITDPGTVITCIARRVFPVGESER